MTSPFLSTAATLLRLLFQAGGIPELTQASSDAVFPLFSVMEVRFSLITGDCTVTWHSFVTPSTLAVIMAVPCFFAVIMPSSLTTATLFFLDFHMTLRPEDTLAVRRRVCLRYNFREEWFNVTFGLLTVTLQVLFVPSALAVTVHSPGFLASILPLSSMDATLERDALHVMAEPLDVLPRSRKDAPFSIVMEAADSVIAVFSTVSRQLASPPVVFPVIRQVPALLAVTSPYVFTEAVRALLLLHVILFPLLETPAR